MDVGQEKSVQRGGEEQGGVGGEKGELEGEVEVVGEGVGGKGVVRGKEKGEEEGGAEVVGQGKGKGLWGKGEVKGEEKEEGEGEADVVGEEKEGKGGVQKQTERKEEHGDRMSTRRLAPGTRGRGVGEEGTRACVIGKQCMEEEELEEVGYKEEEKEEGEEEGEEEEEGVEEE
ncbi:unnamed protein product [Closterium sp. Naga37s-1]|nr:unnamed protein product [Closterium sp. Naga37s-1]